MNKHSRDSEPSDVTKTEKSEIPDTSEHVRFVSGWWIIPVVILGLVIWFFILRIAFFK